MEKTIKLLAVVLGVQLLLALGLSFSGRGLTTSTETGPLVAVAKEQIDRITLEEPDQPKVVLAKKAGSWRLPDAGDFPADADRVAKLLDKLVGLKTGAPVAGSAGARKRFKVSDDDFERRITLAAGDKALATLYLGTSPGARRVHARAAEQDAIHAVELVAYDIPVKSADWQDKSVLRLPKDAITAIEVAGLRFERTPPAAAAAPSEAQKSDTTADTATPPTPAWEAKGAPTGQHLNPEAAEKLAGLLADLRIGEVLGKEAKPDYGLAKPILELTAMRNNGDSLTYQLGKAKDKEEYTLKVSNRPEYFRLPPYTAKPLVEAGKREALVEASPKDKGKVASASGQKP